MILTIRVKHNLDLSEQLDQARQVAEFAVANKSDFSSASVSHFGLPSAISNQILRKYGRKRGRAKRASSVVLTVPGQSVSWNRKTGQVRIACLDLEMSPVFRHAPEKINQVELDSQFACISFSVEEPEEIQVSSWLGVDLNTTGHSAVAANAATGKVMKLAKSENHIRTKYRRLRKKIQESQKLRNLKKIKRREARKIRDLNHKTSRRIVDAAAESDSGIVMEDLSGIRESTRRKSSRKFRGALNNWSFHQLRQFVEYKARLLGIPVLYVDPAYTSKTCSRCGLIGKRSSKTFRCPGCGHADHADVNAAFNISGIALNWEGSIETGALIPRWGNAA